MSNNRQTPDAVRVTQADRDSAADGCGSVSKAKVIRRGEMDHTVLVQAFARHRLAALDSRAGDAGEGLPTINENQAYRLRKAAEADCGCRIPAPFDEVADHVARIAFDEAIKRCRSATPAPAVDAGDGPEQQAFIFDVLEALKPHFPRIAFCFARGTGGIERRDVLAILNGAKAPAVDAVDDSQINATPVDDHETAVDAVPAGEVERFVIRRNGAFFRPNAQGYTSHIVAAGFYTREEADSYASVEGVTIEPLECYRAEAERTIAEANRLLAALSHGEGRK